MTDIQEGGEGGGCTIRAGKQYRPPARIDSFGLGGRRTLASPCLTQDPDSLILILDPDSLILILDPDP